MIVKRKRKNKEDTDYNVFVYYKGYPDLEFDELLGNIARTIGGREVGSGLLFTGMLRDIQFVFSSEDKASRFACRARRFKKTIKVEEVDYAC